jgi:hypothetical protein
VKKERALAGALARLSMRERVMLGVLAALVAASAAALLVVLPAFDRMASLRIEIGTLQDEKAALLQTTDLSPQYRDDYKGALKEYKDYRRLYYPFLHPESIDKSVTGLLLEAGLEPLRLTMGPLAREDLPAYVEHALVPRPVPVPQDDGKKKDGEEGATGAGAGETEAGAAAAAGTGDAAAAGVEAGSSAEAVGEAAPAPAPAPAPGASVYCYTVDVEATGEQEALYRLLAQVRSLTAMETVSFSYTPPAPESPPSGDIRLQLKLYAFIEGGVQSEKGEEGDTHP